MAEKREEKKQKRTWQDDMKKAGFMNEKGEWVGKYDIWNKQQFLKKYKHLVLDGEEDD